MMLDMVPTPPSASVIMSVKLTPATSGGSMAFARLTPLGVDRRYDYSPYSPRHTTTRSARIHGIDSERERYYGNCGESIIAGGVSGDRTSG